MELKQIPPTSNSTSIISPVKHHKKSSTNIDYSFSENNPSSNALPLLLYLTNVVFFAAVYFLLVSWRDKIRHSKPLHLVSSSEITALLALAASFVYLLGGFFGIGSVFINPLQESQEEEEEKQITLKKKKKENDHVPVDDDHVKKPPPPPAIKSTDDPIIMSSSSQDDEDVEIVKGVAEGRIPSYSLESKLGDCKRAAAIRRKALERITGKSLDGLPLESFDYESILGQCCEMPVGYVQIPVGIAGPLLLDGEEYSVPMATTEGCLVASTNRGCKAIYASGGATSVVLRDGMTRAPVVRFSTAKRAAQLKFFLEDPLSFETIAAAFNKSSRFARLQSIKCAIAGKNLYMRFTCSTGDAMGMNMVSKGVQNVLDFLQTDFPDMDIIGISGNFCSDKKPAAVNWIEGRGKSVVGSAMAGALGGFNAHAANIVSAVYIATGQDPAQNIESSHCITMMEAVNQGKDLHISVTMPSIEVGTVGGGTQLASQAACLNLLGVKGASKKVPGANSRRLATVVAGAVLAGELSLMSAIAAGQLVKSHMKYNRSNKP